MSSELVRRRPEGAIELGDATRVGIEQPGNDSTPASTATVADSGTKSDSTGLVSAFLIENCAFKRDARALWPGLQGMLLRWRAFCDAQGHDSDHSELIRELFRRQCRREGDFWIGVALNPQKGQP